MADERLRLDRHGPRALEDLDLDVPLIQIHPAA